MRELNLKVPAGYPDLTDKQKRFIGYLYLDPGNKVQLLVQAFIHLSGLQIDLTDPLYSQKEKRNLYQVRKPKEKPSLISGSDLVSAANHVKWILDLENVKPLSRIRLARPVHHRFYNASLDQYLMMENFFEAYQHTQDQKHLNNLIATLYRLPWKKYESAKIQKRGKRYQNISQASKEVIILWVLSLRKYLMEAYPDLFDTGAGTRQVSMRETIQTFLRGLNKGDITKNTDLLEKPAHDALAELNAMAREAKEIKKRINNVRR